VKWSRRAQQPNELITYALTSSLHGDVVPLTHYVNM
jgi:hypothetical protein